MLERIHSLNEASSFRKRKSGLFLDSIDKTLQGADVGSQKVPEPLQSSCVFSYLFFFLSCLFSNLFFKNVFIFFSLKEPASFYYCDSFQNFRINKMIQCGK